MARDSYTADDRIKVAGQLRQLAKEMTEGDPKTAAMLVQSARMIERQSPPTGPSGTQNAAPQPSTATLSAGPSQKGLGQGDAADAAPSVGPWKECVYKHPDAPKVASWVQVEGFAGVLKHCEARDGCRVELGEAVFCITRDNKWYALKLPQLPPPATGGTLTKEN